MWYEYLYSGFITLGFIAGGMYMSVPFNLYGVGRLHRRNQGDLRRIFLSMRDHRLTGNQYVISDLNSIADE